jgi:hypothetical protein
MHCANGDGYLHLHQAMQQYAELPSELLDRILGIGKVYLQQSPLTS